MTAVYITIDTEYAANLPGAGGGPDTRQENFARSIACSTSAGDVGIFHQMDVMDAHGIKGVFFVDPMPALLWGVAAIEDIVRPILQRGHAVQLHCHTEWLALAPGNGLAGGRTGQHLHSFAFDDQCAILDYARDTLIAAGAPPPMAFRAGNYGANDDTLRALAEIGVPYDTSHCPALAETGDCRIGLGPEDRRPLYRHGTIEIPVAGIGTVSGGMRHAQVTAVSADEMLAAISHARDHAIGTFVIVSHSFELLSRDRQRKNRIVARRFERLCAGIAALDGVRSATIEDQPPRPRDNPIPVPLAPPSALREGARIVEQVVANAVYAHRPQIDTRKALAATAILLC